MTTNKNTLLCFLKTNSVQEWVKPFLCKLNPLIPRSRSHFHFLPKSQRKLCLWQSWQLRWNRFLFTLAITHFWNRSERLVVYSWLVTHHWGRDKMTASFQTILSNAFSWMKIYKFRLRFHWSLFPINNIPALVRIMAWRTYASLGLNGLQI